MTIHLVTPIKNPQLENKKFNSSQLVLNFEFVSERARQASAVRFYVQLFDFAVVDNHRKSLGAEPAEGGQSCAEVQGLDEVAAGVGEHANLKAKRKQMYKARRMEAETKFRDNKPMIGPEVCTTHDTDRIAVKPHSSIKK
ncbi:hypothetical protein MSG28_013985 [Choristoneura fumiferana]|uniref:Uncharacterized protein n=1 Tax=Choristoneura fumiferana TaxID=7141 RepID=A0ACC0K9N6_CHOFU|nr:hypothetical protein MSG28_013985 [Choristoneura fumiferana]